MQKLCLIYNTAPRYRKAVGRNLLLIGNDLLN